MEKTNNNDKSLSYLNDFDADDTDGSSYFDDETETEDDFDDNSNSLSRECERSTSPKSKLRLEHWDPTISLPESVILKDLVNLITIYEETRGKSLYRSKQRGENGGKLCLLRCYQQASVSNLNSNVNSQKSPTAQRCDVYYRLTRSMAIDMNGKWSLQDCHTVHSAGCISTRRKGKVPDLASMEIVQQIIDGNMKSTAKQMKQMLLPLSKDILNDSDISRLKNRVSLRLEEKDENGYSTIPQYLMDFVKQNKGAFEIGIKQKSPPYSTKSVEIHQDSQNDNENFAGILEYIICVPSYATNLIKFFLPIVAADGCHLSQCRYKLLLIVGRLARKNAIISFSICGEESSDTYNKLFNFTKRYIPDFQSHITCIMSDRDKGLIKAVDTVFPQIHHHFDFPHILRNFNSYLQVKVDKKMLYECLYSTSIVTYEEKRNELENKYGNNFSIYLNDIISRNGLENISLAHCNQKGVALYGISSSFVEQMNSVLKKTNIRNQKGLSLLSSLLNKSHQIIFNILTKVSKQFKNLILAHDLDNWQKWVAKSDCYEISCHIGGAIVTSITTAKQYTITKSKNSCSCNFTTQSMKPCLHLFLYLKASGYFLNEQTRFEDLYPSYYRADLMFETMEKCEYVAVSIDRISNKYKLDSGQEQTTTTKKKRGRKSTNSRIKSNGEFLSNKKGKS